jgi:hypothetical protein
MLGRPWAEARDDTRTQHHLLLTAVTFCYVEQAFLLLFIENDHCGSALA